MNSLTACTSAARVLFHSIAKLKSRRFIPRAINDDSLGFLKGRVLRIHVCRDKQQLINKTWKCSRLIPCRACEIEQYRVLRISEKICRVGEESDITHKYKALLRGMLNIARVAAQLHIVGSVLYRRS